jgi:hypothetical protein
MIGVSHVGHGCHIQAYNDNAAPFVWTKAKVHLRLFKRRRISQL